MATAAGVVTPPVRRTSAYGDRHVTPTEERFDDNRTYERFKREARKAYQRAYGAVSDDQWDAAFNMSYWKLCQAETVNPGIIEHPVSWIATIAKNEIVSEHRKTSRQASLADCPSEPAADGQDLLNAIERRHVLRDVGFILSLLPSRQKRVWAARFVWDYSPEEIMQLMDLSRKAYEKALQQATSFLIAKLEHARHGVCATAEMESLVRGYAIWGDTHYSPGRSALAQAHLDDCAACRHTARLIRSARNDVRQPADQRPGNKNVKRTAAHTAAARLEQRPARLRDSRRALASRRQRVLA